MGKTISDFTTSEIDVLWDELYKQYIPENLRPGEKTVGMVGDERGIGKGAAKNFIDDLVEMGK
jgi:hypothetical protein